MHRADDWRSALKSAVDRYLDEAVPKVLRADAAFASPEDYEYVEATGFSYDMRLPGYSALEDSIRHLLTSRVGRQPRKPFVMYYSFSYQLKSWSNPGRVVARLEKLLTESTRDR